MSETILSQSAYSPNPTIFRAYDIRGVVGTDLNPTSVHAIGRALGSEAAARGLTRIAIGRDGRLSGPELSTALADGLRASGMEVLDVGMVPTPVLYFAAHTLADGSGVMLTGSHNPPQYNGLKMVLGGETLAAEAIQGLRRRIEEGDYRRAEGSVREVEVLDDYVARIVADVRPQRALKVVLDCGNGVAGVVAPRLMRELGCEVAELFCDVDGHFPNHHPDPSQPENLQAVIAKVREAGADLGLAFDGDGDRIGVIAPDGAVIWPDRLMMLYARDVLERNPGAEILFDVKCTGNLAGVIAAAGGEPVMWRTGHSLIKARMKQGGSLLAGEMSGHIFIQERWYGFDDALYAAARLIEYLARQQASVQALFDELPDALNTPELRVETEEGENFRFMERLVAQEGRFGGSVNTIDGLRVDYDDGWGLVRASNTTPCLVVRFEADDEAALARIQERFREVILELEPGLTLPF